MGIYGEGFFFLRSLYFYTDIPTIAWTLADSQSKQNQLISSRIRDHQEMLTKAVIKTKHLC